MKQNLRKKYFNKSKFVRLIINQDDGTNIKPSPFIIDLKNKFERLKVEEPQVASRKEKNQQPIFKFESSQKFKDKLWQKLRKRLLLFFYFFKRSETIFSPRFIRTIKTNKIDSRKNVWWRELTLFNLWSLMVYLVRLIVRILKKLFFKFGKKEHSAISGRREQNFFAWQIPRDWRKKLAVFLLVSFIFILPLRALTYYYNLEKTKKSILAKTTTALGHLKSAEEAASTFNLSEASWEFSQAAQNFSRAREELETVNLAILSLLKFIPKEGGALGAGQRFLAGGENISQAAEYFAQGLEFLSSENNSEISLIDKLSYFRDNLNLSHLAIQEAVLNLEGIKSDVLPEEKQVMFLKVQAALPFMADHLEKLSYLLDNLLEVLGQERRQRYLVIFQNNAELRATGGFMGSFALIDVDRGELKQVEIPTGGTYDLKGSLLARVRAPEPLTLINPRWEFQDANWFFDFPTSSQKIIWFYEKSGGPTVDGVIALDVTFFERLLEVIGEISLPEYNKVINQDNFFRETQEAVELEYDKKLNQPKKFIADLTPKILERLTQSSPQEFLEILEILVKSFKEKHLLVFFNDSELERMALDLNLAGEIKKTPSTKRGDYLAVVHSNIGGEKSDRVIEDKIRQEVSIQKDGSIINKVTIIRYHRGQKGELFTGSNNVDYLRIYVPLGSTLLAANGFNPPQKELFETSEENYPIDDDLFKIQGEITRDDLSGTEIYREIDKTVFANWLQVKPGESVKVSVEYLLPFGIKEIQENQDNSFLEKLSHLFKRESDLVSSYNLIVQKQPGTQEDEYNLLFKLPAKNEVIWHYPSQSYLKGSLWESKVKLDTDKFYALIFK